MSELRPLLERLRLPFWHREDIEAEIASHLAEVEADLRAHGLGETEAHRAAVERLGNLDSLGDSLQAVHQGWSGGATVERRFAGAVVTTVVFCALAVAWIALVVSVARPWVPETAPKAPVISFGPTRGALQVHERDELIWRFQQESADLPYVSWLGIVDRAGTLIWGQPEIGLEGRRLPDAEAFVLRFDKPNRPVANASSFPAEWTDASVLHSLTRALASSGIPAVRYERRVLGDPTATGYRGTGIIAYGPALWSEQVLAVLANVWLWYGLIWLFSPLIMLAHHRQWGTGRGSDWAIVAFLFGPPIWLAYAASFLARRLRGQATPSQRALAIVPAAGVVLTVLMLVRPLWPALHGAVDLYAIQPERGAETLSRTPSGVRVLLGAAESGQYLVRRAAVRSLSHVASPEQGISMLASWTHMLDSKYPETRQRGWEALQQILFQGYHVLQMDDLLRAWKTALTAKDAQIRAAAWTFFSLSLARPEAFPSRFEDKIPALLALGANDAILHEHYGRWLQYGQTVYDLGQVSVGSTKRFTVDVKPSASYVHPERAQPVALVTATSPHIRTSLEELGDGASPVVRLHVAYSAHGPAGVHHERMNLMGKNGRLIGVVDLRAEEAAAR